MKKRTSLEDFGRDLTAEAAAGRMDPVIGRVEEIDRVITILARKTKRNPVLLGAPGVGKTAVAEGLAQRVAAGTVPAHLQGRSVYSLSLGALLAGTGYRGDFEQRLQDLVNELKRPGANRVLFIDEIHLLGKAGKSEGGMDAANFLKPLLARGEIPCMGATTDAEWAEMIARDPAMERRFQPVEVIEPSSEDTVRILRGLRARFETHHGVVISDDALEAAVAQAALRRPNLRFPDKAVDLLDEACARCQIQTSAFADSPEVSELKRKLCAAEDAFDLESVARLRYQALPKLAGSQKSMPMVVDASFIAAMA